MATKKATTKTTTPKNATTKATKKAAPKKVATTKPEPPAAETKAKSTNTDKPKGLSALDAAAKVLAESETPLNSKQMIEAMATQQLWTSPGGKTPHATLYSAILREINTKGKDARFKKVERGQFAANG